MVRFELYPTYENGEKDECLIAFGVEVKRYILIPADYDGSVDAYDDHFDKILATSDSLQEIKAICLAFRQSLFMIDTYSIFDTEKDDFIDY